MPDTQRKFCQLALPDISHTGAGLSHTHTHTHFHKQKQKWRHQWAPFPTMMMMMMMMIIVIGEAAFGCCYEIIDFCGPKGGCRIIFAHVFAPLSMSRVPSINIGPVHAWSGVFPFGPTNQDG